MKQPKLRTDIKFFIAMRITETLGTAADAMSMTFKQLLWHDDDGDIVVDFEDRSINVYYENNGIDLRPYFLKLSKTS
jgi:hypothetical protein